MCPYAPHILLHVLYAAPASDQLQHQNDDCYYQENVNKIADRLACKPKTQRP